MSDTTYHGTDEQLFNALDHMAENRPITRTERAIIRAAREWIVQLTTRAEAAEAKLEKARKTLLACDAAFQRLDFASDSIARKSIAAALKELGA